MALSEVRATGEYSRDDYRAPDRRGQDHPAHAEPSPAPPADAEPSPPAPPSLDVAYHASRFRADLSQLKLPPGPERPAAEPSEGRGDPALFDFFGNLSVLLLAVRTRDLARAQAAADALEMELLVERSAGSRGGEPDHRLEDLSRLLGAARTRDVAAAEDYRAAIPTATPWREPPPDAYAELDSGGAAYDTLAHYFDDEARVV